MRYQGINEAPWEPTSKYHLLTIKAVGMEFYYRVDDLSLKWNLQDGEPTQYKIYDFGAGFQATNLTLTDFAVDVCDS